MYWDETVRFTAMTVSLTTESETEGADWRISPGLPLTIERKKNQNTVSLPLSVIIQFQLLREKRKEKWQ